MLTKAAEIRLPPEDRLALECAQGSLKQPRMVANILYGVLVVALAGCSGPGPLSAAARGLEPPPPLPAWANALAGRPFASTFPGRFRCLGSVDTVTYQSKGVRRLEGWGWNHTAAQPIARIVVVDRKGLIVGFGEGGLLRPDVRKARAEVVSASTGWSALGPIGDRGDDLYGVELETKSACSLGRTKP